MSNRTRSIFKKKVHASFCELREWHRNVNSTFCGLSSKLGGIVLSWEDFQAIGVKAMDGKVQVLKEKLERLLREAAETAAELQATERGAGKPVHFSEIEAAASGWQPIELPRSRTSGARGGCRFARSSTLSRVRGTMPLEDRKTHYQFYRRPDRGLGAMWALHPLSAGFFSLNVKL